MVGALRIPRGAGRVRITKLSGPENSIHKKKSIVQIINDDQLCMARSIAVCLAKHCIVPDDEWVQVVDKNRYLTNLQIMMKERKISQRLYKNICNLKRPEQRLLAIFLCEKAGVPIDRPGSLKDLPSFEEVLHVRIAVLAVSLGNKFIRVPDNKHEDWPILYLYLVDHQCTSHFNSIVNIAGFFSAIYFCERCFKHYNQNTNHCCESKCLTCKSQKCPETDSTMCCRLCHMVCRSMDCFKRHLEKKTKNTSDNGSVTSQCEQFWRCITCKKVINCLKRPIYLHKCTEWLCKCCKTWVIGNHQCYLFPEELKKPVKKFIFFDFEATQDTIASCKEGYVPDETSKCQRCFKSWCGQPRHVPNFVVAQKVCESCINDQLTPNSICGDCGTRCKVCDAWDKENKHFVRQPCVDTCGFREVIFQGDNTLEEFGNWLFCAQHKDTTVLAHNMKVSKK